jgi:hypothetical protein
MKRLIVGFCIFTTACASTSTEMVVLASGEHAIAIDCAGHSQNSCLIEAGEQCPNGYGIQDEEGHFTRSLVAVANGTGGMASEKEVHSGSMIIQCHGLSRAQIEAQTEPNRFKINTRNEQVGR